MCGIFGWQFKTNKLPTMEQRSILAAVLGLQNEKRGTDSFGWADTESWACARGLGRIGPHARKMAALQCAIGHTRHGTTGTVSIANAHPFKVGNILGCHNGIIHNHDDLNKERKKAGEPELEVDSQHIFHALNKGNDLKAIRGYGAIEWLDKSYPGAIWLCRMTGSADLAVVQTPYGVIWSSDKEHLANAVIVAGIKATEMEVKAEQVYYAKGGTYYIDEGHKIELGQVSYAMGVYGSRMWEPRESNEDAKGGTLLRLPFGDDSEMLTKKQRKQLVKRRNADLRKSPEKSFSANFYVYKDLCPCGAWEPDKDPHKKHCPKHKAPVISACNDWKCNECYSRDDSHRAWCDSLRRKRDAERSSAVVCSDCNATTAYVRRGHEEWCKKLILVPRKSIEVKGIFIGSTWVCPECYNEPQVWDQECPIGHGRVVGDPKQSDQA